MEKNELTNKLIFYPLNLEHFIAKKVGYGEEKTFTKTIMRIAIVSIAISLAVMIITTSLIAGFKQEITEKIFGFWGHIHITDANVSLSKEPRPLSVDQKYFEELQDIAMVEYQSPISFLGYEFEDQYRQKSTYGGVRHVQGFAMAPGIITTKKDFEGIIFKGIGTDFDWQSMEVFLEEGEKLNLDNITEKPSSEILISRKTADRLYLKVGSKFILHFIKDGKELKRRFVIKGIYNSGLGEYDKKFVVGDIRHIQELYGWEESQLGGLEVFVEDINDMNILSEYIYYNVVPSNLYAETIRDKFPNIFEWLGLQDINEVVILIMMIIVSIINMITALLILILERTKMIGILKTLGSTNWNIRKVFLYQAAYIISRGLFWGTCIGVGICMIQKYTGFVKLDEANYYLDVAPIVMNWSLILLLNILTLLVTLLFLIGPTYLITRINPIKVLRFD